MPICTCNTSVFGTSASIMGSELQPPALRFAPAPCCRGFLMYRLAGSGVHKKHNTHQSTSGPLPCTIEAIIRSGTGTHPPARPTRPFSPNVGEEEFCELRLLGILGSWTSTFRSSPKFAKENALNGTKFIR